MKTARDQSGVAQPPGDEASPRVVYLQAPVVLGRVVELEGDRCVVEIGGQPRDAELDPSVDPALVEEAFTHGSRVVLDTTEGLVVVGTLTTQRTLAIDRDGRLEAKLSSLSLSVEDDLLLKSSGAFIRLKKHEAEIYANRILHRARGAVRLLGAVIKLN